MTEGGTYVCGWSHSEERFRLWVEDEPELTVSGDDFEATADELASLIGERYGDGEAVLEFPSGRPFAIGPGVLARLRDLGYNESVKAVNHSAELYSGGICGHCGFGVGERTEVPLEVNSLPKGNIAGVDGTSPWALLLSERFLGLLTPEERAGIRVQNVKSKGRRAFFELVGDPITRTVGVAGAEYVESFLRSWRCKDCSSRMMTVEHPEFPTSSDFFSVSEVGHPTPSVFVFDHGYRLGIAVSEERWQALARSPGAKGVSTSDLFLLTKARSTPEPGLPEPDDFDW